MKYTIRQTSLATGEKTLEPLYTLNNFPVYIGCTDVPASQDVRADMEFDICAKSGFIQLRKLLPLEVVYNQFHSEALGEVWKAHHQEFAEFVAKFQEGQVLEIGGSSGVLAELLLQKVPQISWTIIEPNPPEQMPDPKIKLITGFFDENFNPGEQFNTVVHSHLLEHLYDPLAALRQIHKILPAGGKHIFTIPNLYQWLKNKFPNALNFEHTMFLTEDFTDYFLSTHGFRILEKHHFQDHSIFYAAEKDANAAALPLPQKYAEYKKLYLDFIDYHKREADDLNQKIEQFGGTVYLFGAHIFSQALLQFGLRQEKIKAILDNSKIKQAKRLYGSNLTVASPEQIKEESKVAVILRAGVYNKEITEQLLSINPQVVIF